jgi:thiamine pyrophosphate-dependent acetolactate synthase large subunit-like protein
MKHLIKQYLDSRISRRQLLSGLGTLGITAAAANSMAQSLAPFLPAAAEDAGPNPPSGSSASRNVQGTGGALLVAQLKASGVGHIFFNPSSGAAPFFDALVDEPQMTLIKALQEGALVAMADGYAKASGKTPFVICARPGFPNSMTQLYNVWKDEIPMVVAVDYVNRATLGEDGFEDADHLESIAHPITKWNWVAQSADKIPEVTRRAFKFASTMPSGPVFLAYPEDILDDEAQAAVIDQAKFEVSMRVRPDSDLIEKAARMLLEAQSPVLYVGDEIARCGAQKDVVELAELLGMPVTRDGGTIGWSKAFPTKNPLYLGAALRQMRYPSNVDVILNLGSRLAYGERIPAGIKLIQVRMDPTNLARTAPTDVAIFGDLKFATEDLVAALKSMATADRLRQISQDRSAKTHEYTATMAKFRESLGRETWNHSPTSYERLGMELETALDKDACVVAESDSGRKMEDFMSFGGSDKQFFTTTGAALGWGLPAAFGVKLAHPDLQVVSVVGDGAFLFAGPQPLWSYARYKAPVTIIVCNNRSYNNERNRIWNIGGRQFQTGRDMTCYLGDPDIDYAKLASGFGVEGEIVAEPGQLQAALQRAKRATADGRPYLLDVHIERNGIGATSTWYPPYSIADLRQRKV